MAREIEVGAMRVGYVSSLGLALALASCLPVAGRLSPPVAGATTDRASGPSLVMPTGVFAEPGGQVTVPVAFGSGGAAISSVVFSIDYDESLLSFDARDANGDGIPDAVEFTVPPAFVASAAFDPADLDGELDFFVVDMSVPLAALPDGTLATVDFVAGHPETTTEARVGFSADPLPSFGDTSGRSVAGGHKDGSVLIQTQGHTEKWSIYMPATVRR